MSSRFILLIVISGLPLFARAAGSASLGYGVTSTSEVMVTVEPPTDAKWLFIFITKDGAADHQTYIFANTGNFSHDYNIPLLSGPGTYAIAIEASVEGQVPSRPDIHVDTLSVYNSDHSRDPYLMATPNIPSDNPAIQRLAQTVVQDQTDPYEKAKLLYGWVARHIHYDHDKLVFVENNKDKFVPADALLTLSTEKGLCQDFAVLLVSLLRAQGIEARLARGIGGQPGPSAGPHEWVQAWNGTRWFDMDPTFEANRRAALDDAPNKKIAPDTDEFKYFDPDPGFFAGSHQLQAIAPE